MDTAALVADIKRWGSELGFQQLGVTDIDLAAYAPEVRRWIADGFHGSMAYMEADLEMRLDPDALLPGTVRVIAARMDYLPQDTTPLRVLGDPALAYISRYALGRDYHKLVRARLTALVERIRAVAAPQRCRAFTDSAPILEKALAEKAGLGWIGKNTLLLNRRVGSFFFLGEIYTDLPLPVDAPDASDHCGACRACINVCPTGAIVGAKRLDARRCVSYLTIEHKGAIPLELRRSIGNRVFGCDDCQLVCPWNRFATPSAERDFVPRASLDHSPLLSLFEWDEPTFLARTEGSALRRINHRQWQRNLAVALGNAPYDPAVVAALAARRSTLDPITDALVLEHVDWALAEQHHKSQRGRLDVTRPSVTGWASPEV